MIVLLLLAGCPKSVFGQSAFPSTYAQLSAGAYHAAVLDTAGTIWVWGRNNTGQLGDGTTTDRAYPTALAPPAGVGAGTRWTAVCAGTFHTAAVRSDGNLWTWGDNTNGQLGDGTHISRLRPLPVAAPATAAPGTRWTQVAVGTNHTLALRSDGTLWAWGANYWGQLGDNSLQTRLRPVQIQARNSGQGVYWVRVVSTDDHALALTSDGLVSGWGRDQRAQLGTGTPNGIMPFPVLAFATPLPVGQYWTELATGEAFSLALRSDGTLWVCGANESNQLGGVVTPTNFVANPVPVPPPVGTAPGSYWAHISARGAHALAWRTDGSLWSWGENYEGQLGINSTANPTGPVREYTGCTWGLAAAGTAYAIAVTGGQLRATGDNAYGQFGDGTTRGSLVFRSIAGPLAERIPSNTVSYALWPNPAKERVYVSGLSPSTDIQLIDLMGRVCPVSLAGKDCISLTGITKGIYLVRVQNPGKASQTLRLNVE